jgi:hypothetical protein
MLYASVSYAALEDRGGGLIYDTDRNITWLQDANYAMTSGYDSDGRMNWQNANALVNNLIVHDSIRNVDYSDWRLPSGESGCSYMWDCNYGEIGHLFFDEVGAKRGSSIFSARNKSNLNLFSNLQEYVYWTNLTDNRYPTYDPGAIGFDFYNGTQSDFWQRNDFYVLAVRDGDVAAIPEPETYIMLLAGLGLMGFIARRSKNFNAFIFQFRQSELTSLI